MENLSLGHSHWPTKTFAQGTTLFKPSVCCFANLGNSEACNVFLVFHSTLACLTICMKLLWLFYCFCWSQTDRIPDLSASVPNAALSPILSCFTTYSFSSWLNTSLCLKVERMSPEHRLIGVPSFTELILK